VKTIFRSLQLITISMLAFAWGSPAFADDSPNPFCEILSGELPQPQAPFFSPQSTQIISRPPGFPAVLEINEESFNLSDAQFFYLGDGVDGTVVRAMSRLQPTLTLKRYRKVAMFERDLLSVSALRKLQSKLSIKILFMQETSAPLVARVETAFGLSLDKVLSDRDVPVAEKNNLIARYESLLIEMQKVILKQYRGQGKISVDSNFILGLPQLHYHGVLALGTANEKELDIVIHPGNILVDAKTLAFSLLDTN
jgi:hypothetical protein